MRRKGFTLPEVLVAVSIFAIVSTVVASLYVQSFRESKRSSFQNQVYEDARFVLRRIADEIQQGGTIDYDEYYNQNVVIPTGVAPPNSTPFGLANYGQNYGRYFSSFFNPGSDRKLGFLCNDNVSRNQANCTPLRKTIDRNTGSNPFIGKYAAQDPFPGEDAFCGTVSYDLLQEGAPAHQGLCNNAKNAPDPVEEGKQNVVGERKELYLISADARKKTILAREKIGGTQKDPIYALSILRLDGYDMNNDKIPDSYICNSEFQCRGGDQFDVPKLPKLEDNTVDSDCFGDLVAHATDLPRASNLPGASDLSEDDNKCDPKSGSFSKDFVPISPFRISIKDIFFYITPKENPHYAFAENSTFVQPTVTIKLTVVPNPEYATLNEEFDPLTLTLTVSTPVKDPVLAPLLINSPPL